MMFVIDEQCVLCSQKACQKCILQESGDPVFKIFPLSALLTQQTLKKLNFWEKTAVEKSAWIKACYDVNADETWLSGIGFV